MLVDECGEAVDDRRAVLPGDRAGLHVDTLAEPDVHARLDEAVEVLEAAFEVRLDRDAHGGKLRLELEREPERRLGVGAVLHVEADEHPVRRGARADLRAVLEGERRVDREAHGGRLHGDIRVEAARGDRVDRRAGTGPASPPSAPDGSRSRPRTSSVAIAPSAASARTVARASSSVVARHVPRGDALDERARDERERRDDETVEQRRHAPSGVRARTSAAHLRRSRARRARRAAAKSVAPVVTTSSTRTRTRPRAPGRRGETPP